jgi:serine O-acetyltransferase
MEESAHAPFSLSLPAIALPEYVVGQLSAFFPDTDEAEAANRVMGDTLDRLEHCIRHVRIKGYWDHDGPRFNHLHSDQYAIFLYYLSNTAFKAGCASLAAKTYALNKALHGLDAFYEVEMPGIFALVHPVGTVLGRATYSDYLCVYQNVSVGADPFASGGPVFGEGVVMCGGSRVIGNVNVGSNCIVSAGASIVARRGEKLDVPDGHVAFGAPAFSTKRSRHNVKRDIFKDVV